MRDANEPAPVSMTVNGKAYTTRLNVRADPMAKD